MDLRNKIAKRYITAQEELRQDIKDDLKNLLKDMRSLSNKSDGYSEKVNNIINGLKKIEDKSFKMKMVKGEYPYGWDTLAPFLLKMRNNIHGLDVSLRHIPDIDRLMVSLKEELKVL